MPEEPTGHRFGMVKSEDLRKGQRVVYHPVGHAAQTSIGKIIRIITHPEEVGIRHTVVKVILNEHTNKEAAYKHENIVEILK